MWTFVSPTNLHCSQTVYGIGQVVPQFVSPTNLHCSQTVNDQLISLLGLFPLRIYTALKLPVVLQHQWHSLFPLRIYTALKLTVRCQMHMQRLFPLRIYTALKRRH